MTFKITYRYWLLFCLCLTAVSLVAQPGQRPTPDSQRPNSPESLVDELDLDDTLNVKYFYAENPGTEFQFRDTFMDHFQQYDPIREQDIPHGHLGNLGSAQQALLYQTPFRMGLDMGFHQFDLYQFTASDLPFYKIDKAFSNLFFSQGAQQTQSLFKGQFSRNFEKGLNFSLQYHRYNNLGTYRLQRSRSSAFATGFWYNSPKGKYDAYIKYVYNEMRVRDNGGLRLDTLTRTGLSDGFLFPVFLRSGLETRHANREFYFLQTYNLTGKPDSLATQPARAFLLSHEFRYTPSTYKAFEAAQDTNTSQLFYGPLDVDNRGLRYYLEKKSLTNSFKIATSKSRKKGKEQLNTQRDLIELALHHQYHKITAEPGDSSVNNLYISGRFSFAPSQRLSIKTYAHIALLKQAGDYRAEGILNFDLPGIGGLSAKAVTQAYSPSYVASRHVISEQPVWNNDFGKVLENSLAGSLRVPKIGLQLEAQYHLVTNLIYFDTNSFAQQLDKSINIVKFIAKHHLEIGPLNFDNEVALQEISGDALRLPPLYSRHSLYIGFRIFRQVLNVQAGADLRFSSAYFAHNYQPITGQFHVQNDLKTNNYPLFDAFFNFKVKSLRVFVKMENISRYFRDDLFQHTAYNPEPLNAMRLGVSWQLLN